MNMDKFQTKYIRGKLMASITVPENCEFNYSFGLCITYRVNYLKHLSRRVSLLHLPNSIQFFFFPNLSTIIPTNGVDIASTV